MISLKSKDEIEIMKKCNEMVAQTREAVGKMVRAGVTTKELDQKAEAIIRKKGGVPAFKGYRGFPATICTSINQEVVHGIPGNRVLKEGDVIGVDLGVIYKGYYGDSAATFPVGIVQKTTLRLLKVTEESLYKGIAAAQPGAYLNDIGAAVQEHVENAGYSVVREFVGHGIGQALHEEPQVPNFGVRGTGIRLRSGMVLAIEPMVNEGAPEIRILEDGWTAVTVDGKLSAHFEHSIAITDGGPVILSDLH